MKAILIVGLALCAHLSLAQVAIKELKLDREEEPIVFPLITDATLPLVAKKINIAIKKDWGFDAYAKNPWENFFVQDGASFHYEVGTNSSRVFSVEMQSSYAACGLHITRYDYSFDAKTGDAIDLNKLFGADGQVKLKKALAKTWLAALKDASNDPNESRKDEYKQCLVDNEKKADMNIERMLVLDEGIKFWIEGCLEGTTYDFEADRAHGPHFYSYEQLLPMLTAYGFDALHKKENPRGPVEGLLRGTIDGKYPISLTLLPTNYDDAIKGVIVYDRVGVPIQLTGVVKDNQYTFHEYEKEDEYLSTIEVSWDGTKLTGSFTNLKTKKQMPFVASLVK